jgi:hypothetical protein
MKTQIPEVDITQAQIAIVEIADLAVGPMEVASMVLAGTQIGLTTGAAQLDNVRVTVTLSIALHWSVGVTIPIAGHFGWSGTINLGSPSITVGFGNIEPPGLQNLMIDLPEVSTDDVSATLSPVQNLALGQLVAAQIKAADIVAPVPDFQLTGLGLNKLTMEQVSVPAASIASVRIGSVQGGRIPLGEIDLPGLDLPSEAVGDLNGSALDVTATSNPIGLHADAGVLDATLRTTRRCACRPTSSRSETSTRARASRP